MSYSSNAKPEALKNEYASESPYRTGTRMLGYLLIGAGIIEGFSPFAAKAVKRYTDSEVGRKAVVGRIFGPGVAEKKIKQKFGEFGYRKFKHRLKKPGHHYRNGFMLENLGLASVLAAKRKKKKVVYRKKH
jgi:hypothetical protein